MREKFMNNINNYILNKHYKDINNLSNKTVWTDLKHNELKTIDDKFMTTLINANTKFTTANQAEWSPSIKNAYLTWRFWKIEI